MANVKARRTGAKAGDPYVDPRGYVRVHAPDHPLAFANGAVFEHRKVAWDHGLLTDPALVVHHINGVKTDNRLENLAVTTHSEHNLRHLAERGTSSNKWGRAYPLKRLRTEVFVNRERTHCTRGHEYSEANAYFTPDGRRQCRTCHNERNRAWRAKNKGA